MPKRLIGNFLIVLSFRRGRKDADAQRVKYMRERDVSRINWLNKNADVVVVDYRVGRRGRSLRSDGTDEREHDKRNDGETHANPPIFQR